MSHFIEAADAIRRISKTLESFKIAADLLDRTGSLENAAKEAKKACDVALKQKAKAEDDLNDAIKSLDAVKQEQKALIAATDAKGKQMFATAEGTAKAIAELMTQEAQVKIDAMLTKAKAKAAAIDDAAEKVAAKTADAEQTNALVEAEIAIKQKQLDSLTASLEKLKAKLA